MGTRCWDIQVRQNQHETPLGGTWPSATSCDHDTRDVCANGLHETPEFSVNPPGCTIRGAQKFRQHRSHVSKTSLRMRPKKKEKNANKRCTGAVWHASGCDMIGGAGPAQPTYHHPTIMPVCHDMP